MSAFETWMHTEWMWPTMQPSDAMECGGRGATLDALDQWYPNHKDPSKKRVYQPLKPLEL